MTDTVKLRALISESGLKLSYLAKAIGVSPYGLSLKIDNKNEFKAKEIKTLCKILNINLREKEKIFFADDVEKTST